MKTRLALLWVLTLANISSANFVLSVLNTPHSGNFEGWNGSSNPPDFTLEYHSWGGYYHLDDGYVNRDGAYAFRGSEAGAVLGWGVRMNNENPVEYFHLHLINQTGVPIARLDVGWTAAQYTEAGRASSIRLAHVSPVAGALIESDLFTASATDPEVRSNLTPIATSPQRATITFATPIEPGAPFTIGWGVLNGAGEGANAHIGFTHFTVTVEHGVSAPSTPTGPDAGCVEQELSFTTGGGACTQGHAVEYQFDWGNGTQSAWGDATRVMAYATSGTYDLRVRARCAVLDSTVTEWSDAKPVTISHTVSAPDEVSGPPQGRVGEVLTFTVGGAACCAGHDVLYALDYGDGTSTSWSSATSYEKTYLTPGIYVVVAVAWCPLDAFAFSGYSHAKVVEIVDHWVESPARPAGPDEGCVNQSLTFTAPRQQCNQEHDVLRQFDWGDGTQSDWGSHMRSKVYGVAGIYEVRVRACCVEDGTVVSNWSPARAVTIEHTVSTPAIPEGPSAGTVGQGLMFSTEGSVCCGGHGVEYQFEWGDGTVSDWGGATRVNAYDGADKYGVRARARCLHDSAVQSDWSDPCVVVVEEPSVRIIAVAVVSAHGDKVVQVSFIGQAGRLYHLQFTPDLVKAGATGWEEVQAMEGTGDVDVLWNAVDSPIGYYRIREVSP